jgi:F-type H+-transporting ATPase subunit epsilon
VGTIQCEIVSAEESLFSGAIASLSVRGTIGELGITPGHAPLLTGVAPGAVALRLEDGSDEIFFASGGYLEVQPGFVTLLADTALRAEDLDEAVAEEARQEAARAMEDKNAEAGFSSAAAMMAEALAKQRTLEELRRRRR